MNFKDSLRYWIRLGFTNFGGPAGQIAMMHKDLVERKQWISEENFLRALNFCMILPGPEAQQLATYIGWRMHGIWGGLVAGVWFILPSIFVLLALSWLAAAYRDVSFVFGIFYGLQAVVIAIVAEAVQRIGKRTLHHWVLFLFAVGAFVAIYFLRVPFPAIVFAAATLGIILSLRWPQVFRPRGHGPSGEKGQGNETPTTMASYPPITRTVKVISIFVVLWILPVGAIVAWLGFSNIFIQEAVFFTGAAFVTFGGAYSVLSYIADVAVNVYGWLEPGQMVQGLALAESTPGPLIMVTQFVGFLGAWKLHGELSPVLSGTLGALIVTYVTFLPCFMFIFAGAPYVEALAGNHRLQAGLVGVTSAVVGVILNLAVFFATHALFPKGGQIDLFVLVLSVIAFWVLWRLRWQIHTVVGWGAAIGVAWVLGRNALSL